MYQGLPLAQIWTQSLYSRSVAAQKMSFVILFKSYLCGEAETPILKFHEQL